MYQKKTISFILLFCLVFASSCSYFDAKQLEGTWEYKITSKVEGEDVVEVGRYSFKNDGLSCGKFTKTALQQMSFFQFAYEIEGTWDLTFGNLSFFYDLSTLNVEKDWLLTEQDVEGELRNDFIKSNQIGEVFPITEIGQNSFKMQSNDAGFVKFTRVTENQPLIRDDSDAADDESTDYAYEDKYEKLWIVASNRQLTYEDIKSLNKKELRILRNYFYARFFYKFKSKDLTDFFSQYSWYKPRYDDVKYVEPALTQIQIKNIQFIKQYE